MNSIVNETSGTSGNRPGYKVYSINTSIRNPLRNIEFLEYFVPFDNKPFDARAKEKYLFELVKNGVYVFTNLSDTVKEKIKMNIPLTAEETRQGFIDNPQATGFSNRVVTQLRSLKDQGFINFVQSAKGNSYAIYKITKLGHELLDNNIERSDVYCKSMIGLHGYSIIRTALYNKTRPFLNTLFVIDEVNKQWAKLTGEEPKGILKHEFATFVLTMLDCDYKKAAENIIEYRKKYGKNENENFIKDYCFNKLGLIKVKYETLMSEYVDDVYRKFALTGLIRQRGAYKYTYIDFSSMNIGKVNQILSLYKNYSWQSFNTAEEYYDFLYNIKLPWLTNEEDKKLVLQAKADALGVDIGEFKNVNDAEIYLNRISAQSAISKQVDNYSEKLIDTELLILSKDIDRKSNFDSIPEPLRLEFLLALLLGKKYGSNYVVSNLIYNDEGMPLSFAPAGKADIVYNNPLFSLIVEATMIKDRTQQLNSETTNLTRHMMELKARTDIDYHMSLVAPYIHRDVCDYFQFKAEKLSISICPLTIARLVEICQISTTIEDFRINYANIVSALIQNDGVDNFLKFINQNYFNFIQDNSFYINDSNLLILLNLMMEKYNKKEFIDLRI